MNKIEAFRRRGRAELLAPERGHGIEAIRTLEKEEMETKRETLVCYLLPSRIPLFEEFSQRN